jgi:hypothetical protein
MLIELTPDEIDSLLGWLRIADHESFADREDFKLAARLCRQSDREIPAYIIEGLDE